jgi:hypothetical protein
MFIELIDLLRCVRPHDDTWLVASFNTVSNRFVQEGKLGCPWCSAEYPIHGGIADFTGGATQPDCEEQRSHASHRREELATRAGAYLDATETGATIALGGLWAYAAQELSEMTHTRVIALNPPSEVKESEMVGLVRVESEIPLAAGSVWGVAIDAWFPNAMVRSALRVVRPGGRVVAAASVPPPAELAVLAHDEHYWVAQSAMEVIPIRRANR